MLFSLAAGQYSNLQLNITKVKVHLRNGIATILDHHEDLMGLVENNIVEIESTSENKVEKSLFILQEGVFIVSNKGFDSKLNYKGTGIYVYARNAREILPTTSVDDLLKQYEQKNKELQKEVENIENLANKASSSKILLLEEEAKFLKRASIILKDLKGT